MPKISRISDLSEEESTRSKSPAKSRVAMTDYGKLEPEEPEPLEPDAPGYAGIPAAFTPTITPLHDGDSAPEDPDYGAVPSQITHGYPVFDPTDNVSPQNPRYADLDTSKRGYQDLDPTKFPPDYQELGLKSRSAVTTGATSPFSIGRRREPQAKDDYEQLTPGWKAGKEYSEDMNKAGSPLTRPLPKM